MSENLARLLLDRAQSRPDAEYGVVDDVEPLGSVLTSAAGLALVLREQEGVRTGDRVALIARSSTDFLVSWAACLLGGTPVALINPDYPDDLLRQMLERLDPACIITDDVARFETLPCRVRDISTARSVQSTELTGLPGVDAEHLAAASYMHTSGTTGVPKFCEQSHEYFLRLGRVVADSLAIGEQDRVFAPLPLFHINPLGYGVIGALVAGAEALGASRFSASSFWPDVKRYGFTALVLHEPPVRILKLASKSEDAAGHAVRTMFYTDSEFMRTFSIPRAISGYGSTEAGGLSHVRSWSVAEDIPVDAGRYGGQGRADVEWRLSDDGEVMLRERSPGALFTGYWSSDGVSSARDGDGWFATGDLGRIDDDGGLVFVERSAEAIRVKGEFVPIGYVEDTLAEALGHQRLAIWKRTSDLVDDEVVLYVAGESVPIDVLRRVSATLPSFMAPRSVVRVADIPRDSAAGKVRRRLLTDLDVLERWEMT